MKVVIRTKGIDFNNEIKEFVVNQINLLERFSQDIFRKEYFDHFFGKGKPKVEAWVEIGKETKHRKGPFFYAECQMRFPGKSLRAESLKENLKSAIIEVRKELERQIKEYKRKMVAKIERGARKMKRELKVSPLAKKKEGKRILKEGI